MLQKTIRFDDETRSIIRNYVSWSDDGLRAVVTMQDLAIYKKAKKVFEVLGGQWVKREKATIFDKDPREQIFGVIRSGTLKVARDGFFETPVEVVEKVLSYLHFRSDCNWLEPEAGKGAMVKVLIEKGLAPDRIYAIEQNPDRCQVLRGLGVHVACGDFMRYKHSTGLQIHRVLMNPPFEEGQDGEHVLKAYSHIAVYGMMGAILGEGIFFRDDRKSETFRKWMKAVGAYDEKLPDKSFHSSGTDVSTRFIIVEKL